MIIRYSDHIYKSENIKDSKYHFFCEKCGSVILVHHSISHLRKIEIFEHSIYAYLNKSKNKIISIYGDGRAASLNKCIVSDDDFVVREIIT